MWRIENVNPDRNKDPCRDGKTLMPIREQKSAKNFYRVCMKESSPRLAEAHLQLCSTWDIIGKQRQ
jgi:hypothetical protein